MTDGQKVVIGRLLGLTLDPDQADLIRMIHGQYLADRARLHDLDDPDSDDDEETRDERLRLKEMRGGFQTKATAMINRVLTPAQRAALSSRPSPSDSGAMFERLSTLQRESISGLAAALTPGQRNRLKKFAIDAEGPLAAVRSEVAARLRLSRDQQARVRAIWDVAQSNLNHLRDPSLISPAYREGDDLDLWMKPRLATIRRESARILSDAGEKISQVVLNSTDADSRQ
ncbi:MAG: hypothetical protein NVSMB9_25820 [Isosphaeraceae bacterium]